MRALLLTLLLAAPLRADENVTHFADTDPVMNAAIDQAQRQVRLADAAGSAQQYGPAIDGHAGRMQRFGGKGARHYPAPSNACRGR